MKHDGQPIRDSVPWNSQCTKDPGWLNNVFLFSTEIWAEQLKKAPCRFQDNDLKMYLHLLWCYMRGAGVVPETCLASRTWSAGWWGGADDGHSGGGGARLRTGTTPNKVVMVKMLEVNTRRLPCGSDDNNSGWYTMTWWWRQSYL